LKRLGNACKNMQQLKYFLYNLIDAITYSNFYIAFAAFLLTLQTAFIFNYALQSALFFGFTNFTATFCMYNAQRLMQVDMLPNVAITKWYKRNKKWILTFVLVFISLHISIFKSFYGSFIEGLLLYIPSVLLSCLYFLPPFPLRKFPVLKIFIIGLVWSYTCVVIPLVYHNGLYTLSSIFQKTELRYALSQFFFISAICVPFDIRDSIHDKEYGIKTLPVQFGIKTSMTIACCLLLCYLLLATNEIQLMSFGFISIAGSILILNSTPTKHRYYFSVLVDGLIILQYFLFYWQM